MVISSASNGGCAMQHLASHVPPAQTVERVALDTLPYDVLLVVAAYLDLRDVHALHLTCRSLRDFSMTRPIYRQLAHDLLSRCRALPLRGFTQPADLSAAELIRAVNKAYRTEHQWRLRTPRPIQSTHPLGIHPKNHYLDCFDGTILGRTRRWYRRLTIFDPLEDIEIDWLSSITSNYLLCATKTGKVICWDVQSDVQLAEWSLGPSWELWKCRVDFDRRQVHFAMAEKPTHSDDDPHSDITDFIVVQLTFPLPLSETSPNPPPVFQKLTQCRTVGLVMNFFLLDPANRTIASFVQISGASDNKPDRIGLYMLFDWDTPYHIFIDTGLENSMEANWTCILLDDGLVIHSQEASCACQHMYPIPLLRESLRPLTKVPTISGRVPPFRTLRRKFNFPRPHPSLAGVPHALPIENPEIRMPPWIPESAHFVRQWWPKFGEGHRASSSVLLLRDTEPVSNAHSYAIAQHYFGVPMGGGISMRYPSPSSPSTRVEGDPLTLWHIRSQYEICSIVELQENGGEERRPLIAVDFGHAVWVEYKDAVSEDKILRFVTFPPLDAPFDDIHAGTTIHTLEIPAELNLNSVETINFDQSHGTIMLSVGDGEVFLLCYE